MRIMDWSSDVCSSERARTGGPVQRDLAAAAVELATPHRQPCQVVGLEAGKGVLGIDVVMDGGRGGRASHGEQDRERRGNGVESNVHRRPPPDCRDSTERRARRLEIDNPDHDDSHSPPSRPTLSPCYRPREATVNGDDRPHHPPKPSTNGRRSVREKQRYDSEIQEVAGHRKKKNKK